MAAAFEHLLKESECPPQISTDDESKHGQWVSTALGKEYQPREPAAFWTAYCQAVETEDDSLHLQQRCTSQRIPLAIGFMGEYTNDDILSLVHLLPSVFETQFKNWKPDYDICVVTHEPNYWLLQYPQVRIPKKLRNTIYDRIREALSNVSFRPKLYPYVLKYHPIVGAIWHKSPLRFYGFYAQGKTADLHRYFAPRNHPAFEDGTPEVMNLTAGTEFWCQYWLPLFTSLEYPSLMFLEEAQASNIFLDMAADGSKAQEFELMLNYFDLKKLTPRIFDDIGIILRVIYKDNDERAFTIWQKISKSMSSRERFWGLSKAVPLTIGTLQWHLQDNCPKGYKEWRNKVLVPLIENCVNGYDKRPSDRALADAIAISIRHICVFERIRTGSWWWYHHPKWEEVPEELIGKYIVEKFVAELDIVASDAQERVRIGEVDNVVKTQHMIDKIRSFRPLLENNSTQVGVVKLLRQCLLRTNFNKLFDSQYNLFAVANGVIDIDVKGRNCEYRRGKPEDYISIVSSATYRRDYNDEHPDVQAVLELDRQFVGDADTVHAYQLQKASLLLRGNRDKNVDFFVGPPDSGKSGAAEGLKSVLGEYFAQAESEALTTKRSKPNEPHPSIANASGKAVLAFFEFEQNSTFETAILKPISGRDGTSHRALYSNKTTVAATFKIICYTNHVPAAPATHQGLTTRFRFWPARSKYSRNAPATLEEQHAQRHYPIDDDIDSKIARLRDAILWLMVRYMPEYLKHGRKVSAAMLKEAQDYWDRNDRLKTFVKKYMQVREGALGVTLETASRSYRDYLVRICRRKPEDINDDDIARQLEEYLGATSDVRGGKGWPGRQLSAF